MNKYLLIIKMDGRIYMTNHNSQYSMSREAILVQRENDIKLNLMEVSNLEWQCCLNDYPDNSALAVTMGTDAAIIPMTISELKDHDAEVLVSRNTYETFGWNGTDNESYTSPFDGRRK